MKLTSFKYTNTSIEGISPPFTVTGTLIGIAIAKTMLSCQTVPLGKVEYNSLSLMRHQAKC